MSDTPRTDALNRKLGFATIRRLVAMTAERDAAVEMRDALRTENAGLLERQAQMAVAAQALIAERDALREDAEAFRWFVKHAHWMRMDKHAAYIAVAVHHDADLSSEGMRRYAIDNARKEKP